MSLHHPYHTAFSLLAPLMTTSTWPGACGRGRRSGCSFASAPLYYIPLGDAHASWILAVTVVVAGAFGFCMSPMLGRRADSDHLLLSCHHHHGSAWRLDGANAWLFSTPTATAVLCMTIETRRDEIPPEYYMKCVVSSARRMLVCPIPCPIGHRRALSRRVRSVRLRMVPALARLARAAHMIFSRDLPDEDAVRIALGRGRVVGRGAGGKAGW